MKCPRCGKKGACYCREISRFKKTKNNIKSEKEREDEYTFVCEECGYILKKTETAALVIGDDWITYCPFCVKPCKEHRETPKKYQ